jgi:LuxR family maltose regulon positive regulatory protein
VQSFLLATSLLERFTPALCDSVLEQGNSYRLLKYIEQSNLFVIVLDEQQQWYRYHHLFAEFLRAQLHLLYPERVNSIRTRAALWYVQNGYMTEAITHLLAASDFSLAAEHIEQYCDTLLKRGELSTLLKWTAALPETLVRSHPRLCLYCAAALASTNQLDAAELRVLDAEHFLQKERRHNQDRLQGNLQNVENELITIRASLAGFRGDVQHTHELTQQALAQLAAEDTFTQGILTASSAVAYATQGNVVVAQKMFSEAEALGRAVNHTHLWLASLCSQAYVVMEQGRFYSAAEICRRVMAMEEHQQVTTSSMAYTVMGELHYQWNMLDGAEKFLQRGIEQGQEWGHMNMLARATLFLARTKRALGNEDSAHAVLRDLERQALQHNISQIVTYAHAMQAYFSLANGDIEAAMRWAKGSGLNMHDQPDYLDEFVYLILIQIVSTAGKMDGVISLLERMLRRAQADGRDRNTIDILVMQAFVYDKLANTQQAQNALIRAISLAEPEGNIRAFIEVGKLITQLLRDIMHRREHEVSPAFIQTLLASIGSYHEKCISSVEEHTNIQVHGEALTDRECEIVRLLAVGLSNQQIADTLVIAVSTVKWYLKQLSRKLNAHNRTQIVAYAQAKNLL